MNKKIISILLIFSLLIVGLGSLSAVDEALVVDSQGDNINPTSTGNIQVNENVTQSDNNTTTNDTNNTKDNGYPDVVVPTNEQDLNKFNILMNFVTPEGKEYFADQLAAIDSDAYKDVITALKNNDMDNLLYYVGKLDQSKIDEFFSTFVKIFDTTSSNDGTNTKSNSNSVSDSISSIFGSSQQDTSSYVKTQKVATSNDKSSQTNPVYTFKNKQYSLLDFVNALKVAYENGEITYDQFLQVLKDNNIDTSNIKCEDGIITWGFLIIFPPDNVVYADSSSNVTNTNDSEVSDSNTNKVNTNVVDESSPVDDQVISNDGSKSSNTTG